MIAMTKLVFSFIAAGLIYLVGRNLRETLIFLITVVSTAVYFMFLRSKKVDNLHTLTVILVLASSVLPKLRGDFSSYTTPFYIAILLLVPYSLTCANKLWYVNWAGFWIFISYGLYKVSSFKLKEYSVFIVIAVVPIALRDLWERRKGCGRKVCALTNEGTLDDKSKP